MKFDRCLHPIILSACLLTACSPTETELLESNGSDILFTATAAAGKTKADTGNSLTEGGRTNVYAWQGKNPSETDRPAYSNTYTFQTNNSICQLTHTGGKMQLPVANGYVFYALSTNHADQPVPALVSGNRTVTLENGVDYLMAVSASTDVAGSDAVTVPLAFRHIATRIVLTIRPSDTDGYTSAGSLSTAIAPIDSTGSYIDLSAAWDASNPKDMIYWGTGDEPATGGQPLQQTNGQRKNAEQVSSGNSFTVSFILLPVAGNQFIPLQFDFTNIEFATGGTQSGKTYTATLISPTGGLKGGYTYAYTAKISRYAATFGTLPLVDPWVVDGIGLDEVIEVDPSN